MSKTKTQLEEKQKEKQKKTRLEQYAEGEYERTTHGTKYRILKENHECVVVFPDSFIMNLNRLELFEEFLSAIDGFFPKFVKDAIWEKMDYEIRNADVQKIGNIIKERFLKKWDIHVHRYDNNPSFLLQDPIYGNGNGGTLRND